MIFTIKKGAHYPSPNKIALIDSSKPHYGTLKLFESCWYDTAKYGTHLNKIIGYGCDFLNSDSVRIGYRPSATPGKFEAYIYLHIDGKWVRSTPMKNDLATYFYAEVENNYAILPDADEESDDLIKIVVNGEDVVRHFPVTLGTGWLQKPYFGGNPTAPWEMKYDVTMEGVI